MDYHRMAELQHTARANAYSLGNHHAKATRHRVRAAAHARLSRLRFGGLAKGSEVANADAISRSLSCPITLGLFTDPVVISSGQTVDRKEIERLLRTSDKCPVTNVTITRHLVTNWLVKSMVEAFKEAYGSREGDEWKQIRELCHPAADTAAAPQVAVTADTEEAAEVKRYVQMPYEELERLSDDADDDGAHREIVRRYLLYRFTMRDLDDSYNEQNYGLHTGDVVDETAGEVANDVVSTDALLGFIREREAAQLRRFGAQHLTALARHTAASNASDVPFKLLFGLPVTTEYNEECLYGDTAEEDFWYGD